MASSQTYDDMLLRLRCCVIVPTYNHCKSLGAVLDGILNHTRYIIVINDGSTDQTRHVLEQYPEIKIISYSKNRGKGYALRRGLKAAVELGYDYVITLDSDGQHHPDDILILLEKTSTDPGALLIGSRHIDIEGVPRKLNLGNRLSNFWFYVGTGLKLPDTQSGFRLYPIRKLASTKFVTRRFEFEAEVLVRAAWKGIRILPVPMKVNYLPERVQVSHFRPIADSARITLLNTCLVLLALLFVRPFLFIRSLDRENIRIFYRKYLLSQDESNFIKAASVGVGVCMGIMPFWGWQMAMAIALAYFFKLNKVLTVVASNISIPPLIPFILWGSYALGGLIISSPAELNEGVKFTLGFVRDNLFQYAVGAAVLAIGMGLFMGLLTFVLLKLFRRDQTPLSR